MFAVVIISVVSELPDICIFFSSCFDVFFFFQLEIFSPALLFLFQYFIQTVNVQAKRHNNNIMIINFICIAPLIREM